MFCHYILGVQEFFVLDFQASANDREYVLCSAVILRRRMFYKSCYEVFLVVTAQVNAQIPPYVSSSRRTVWSVQGL